MIARLLADLVVVVHLAYLVFIPLGGFLAWRWRGLVPVHLAATAIAFVSITIGFECPLTTWENSLRRAGGDRRRGRVRVHRALGANLAFT